VTCRGIEPKRCRGRSRRPGGSHERARPGDQGRARDFNDQFRLWGIATLFSCPRGDGGPTVTFARCCFETGARRRRGKSPPLVHTRLCGSGLERSDGRRTLGEELWKESSNNLAWCGFPVSFPEVVYLGRRARALIMRMFVMFLRRRLRQSMSFNAAAELSV
jgi:hypothetical protein